MLGRVGSFLLGGLSLLLLTLNTIFWSIPFFAVVFAKLLVPIGRWRHACAHTLARLAGLWIDTNNVMLGVLLGVDWDIEGVEGLSHDRSYLVNSNHQSWIDIVVLQRVLNRRIPFLRFFIKQQLIWIPLLGLAWWALEMPFMKRYSGEKLAKHPELRGKDLATTRRSCERLRHMPVAIINFLEGTRFTPVKHAAQGSPYRHLLRPKAGGVAFVLGAMGDQLDEMLDVTIVYPGGPPTLWDFVSGRVDRVIVRVKRRPIPAELRDGDYGVDPDYRERFQAWVRELWSAKDSLIGDLLDEAA